MFPAPPMKPARSRVILRVVEILVERGELSEQDVEEAISAQREHRLPFTEILVLSGKLTERQLLSAMTEDLGVPYISSEQLSTLDVPSEVLERFPAEAAERLCALPIEHSARHGSTVVAVAGLAARERISEILAEGTWRPILACTFAIRAGIRRIYYGEAAAFDGFAQLSLSGEHLAGVCPNCRAALPMAALHCPACGLMANPALDSALKTGVEPSVVRALLSPVDTGAFHALRRAWNKDMATVSYASAQLPDPGTIPTWKADLEIALSPLPALEAHVASFVDGRLSVAEIATLANVSIIETRMVIESLTRRDAVMLNEPLGPEPKTDPAGLAGPPPELLDEPATSPNLPPSEVATTRLRSLKASEPEPEVIDPHSPVLQDVIRLEREGRFDDAIAALESALATTSSAALYNKLALVLFKQHADSLTAEKLLERALELEPGNVAYETNLYTVRALSGRRFL
jgi:type IV pilus assembly protein PilB